MPWRSWLRPRSCSGFSSRTIGLRSVAFSRFGRVFCGRSARGSRFFFGFGPGLRGGNLLLGGLDSLDDCSGLDDLLGDRLGSSLLDRLLDDGGLDDLLRDHLGSSLLDRLLDDGGLDDLLGDHLGSSLLDRLLGGSGLDDLLGNRLGDGLLDRLDLPPRPPRA